MPMIIVRCTCGQTMQAPDTAVGKHVRCPKCQAAVPVVASTPPAVPPKSTPNIPPGPLPKPATATHDAPKPAASAPSAPKASRSALSAAKAAVATPSAPPPAPAPAKRGKRRTWMLLGCLGLVLLSCVSGVGFGGYYLYTTIVGALTLTEVHLAKGPDLIQSADVKSVEAKSPDPDAKPPDAKTPDAKAPDPKPPDAKAPDAKSPDDPPSGKGSTLSEPLKKLSAHPYNRILGLRMNAEGVLVTAGADNNLKVWEPGGWKVIMEVESKGRVTALDVAAKRWTAVFFTSKVVNGVATDLKIWRWDFDKAGGPVVIATPRHSPDQLAISPDGKSAVWDDDYRLVIWDLEKNKERTVLEGMYRSQVRGLAMNADATELVTVQDDLSEWWRLKPKLSRDRFKVPGEPHCAAFLTPTTLLMGTFDKKALVWDLTKQQATKEMPLPGPARQVVVSANGKRIALAASKGVVIFDSADLTRPLGTVTMPPEYFADRVALDGPGRLLVTSGNEPEGRCLVWDLSQMK